MIFQHTIDMVLDGTKTQTRRIVKDGHKAIKYILDTSGGISLIEVNNRALYRVGGFYAIQEGRGKKSIGLIHIMKIRREDVRNISPEDVKAEGFASKDDFLAVWRSMHKTYDAWVIEFKKVDS